MFYHALDIDRSSFLVPLVKTASAHVFLKAYGVFWYIGLARLNIGIGDGVPTTDTIHDTV